MKKIVFLFFLISFQVQAQKEDYNWALGNVNINFQTTPPTINKIQDLSHGLACWSDSNGNLLFYADDDYIYNSNNETIYTNTLPYFVFTHRSVIVPHPTNKNQFYQCMIYRKWGFNPDPRLYYVLLDMSYQGGKVIKTQIIEGNKNFVNSFILACRTKQNNWLITYDNELKVYPITKDGFVETPVISKYKLYIYTNIPPKITYDGKKIMFLNKDTLNVLDFDTETGKITQAKKIQILAENTNSFEFSQDNSKLYISSHSLTDTLIDLRQYDMSLLDKEQEFVSKSQLLWQKKQGLTMFDMQAAPDGKIYTCTSNLRYLGCIDNPNDYNANYTENSFDLGTQRGTSMFFPYFLRIQSSIKYTITCSTATFFLLDISQSAVWDFGDGSTSTDLNPSHTYTNSGTYAVQVTVNYYDGSSQTLTKSIVIETKPSKPIILHD